MRFDKNHKAIIKSLGEDEVGAYCEFLKEEKQRHWLAIEEADDTIAWCQATIQLYKSAIIRHKEDIVYAEQNIKGARKHQQSLSKLPA